PTTAGDRPGRLDRGGRHHHPGAQRRDVRPRDACRGGSDLDDAGGAGDPAVTAPAATVNPTGPIDRRTLVARHDPRSTTVRPEWPLQVGNGSFAVAVDLTGLQTHPEAHPHHYAGTSGTLLGTMSQWGWHSMPPARPYGLEESVETYPTPRGPRPYVDLHRQPDPAGQVRGSEAEEWLRNNPHRLHLGRIGFVTATGPDELRETDQHLELWTGVLTSRFRAGGPAEGDGHRATVRTAVHPTRDALGVVSDAGWSIRIGFPYGSESWALADDWERPDAHRTTLTATGAGQWRVDRWLDDSRLRAVLTTDGRVTRTADHEVTVTPVGDTLSLTVEFLPGEGDTTPLPAADVLAASAAAWPGFWESGAAL